MRMGSLFDGSGGFPLECVLATMIMTCATILI